jgi:hypothetical protein
MKPVSPEKNQAQTFTGIEATLIAVLGGIATLIAALVPSWGAEARIIVAAVGGGITFLFPFWNGIHKVAEAILTGHATVNAKTIEAEVLKGLNGVDLVPLVQAALQRQGLGQVEAVSMADLNRILLNLFGPAAADTINRLVPPGAPPRGGFDQGQVGA